MTSQIKLNSSFYLFKQKIYRSCWFDQARSCIYPTTKLVTCSHCFKNTISSNPIQFKSNFSTKIPILRDNNRSMREFSFEPKISGLSDTFFGAKTSSNLGGAKPNSNTNAYKEKLGIKPDTRNFATGNTLIMSKQARNDIPNKEKTETKNKDVNSHNNYSTTLQSTNNGPSRSFVEEDGDFFNGEHEDDTVQKKLLKRKLSKLSKRGPKSGQKVVIPFAVSVDTLSKIIGVKLDLMIKRMQDFGISKPSASFILTKDEAFRIAKSYRLVPISTEEEMVDIFSREPDSNIKSYPIRPPVVTIMGHVDHGKTTLLDVLRQSNVASSEAGGITQHIGAFSVKMDQNQSITFLDTPGHAAFSSMRQRGANITDIAVIVVAADDGVMPQTKEAIKYANEAKVPIIIAITKCDKQNSNPEKIKQQLLENEIQVEDFGGDVQVVEVSSISKIGLDSLKENILTLAEIMELHAETSIPVEAVVIESRVAKGKGNEVSLLVKRGTLKVGDTLVAGTSWCKVRSLSNENGKSIKSAGPGYPALTTGWKDLPSGGSLVLGCESESKAKQVTLYREKGERQLLAIEEIEAHNVSISNLLDKKIKDKAEKRNFNQKGNHGKKPNKTLLIEHRKESDETEKIKTLNVVVKADVLGTLEAVMDALHSLPMHKVKLRVLSSGVGPVSESDIQSAETVANSCILTFNVKADKQVGALAKMKKIQIHSNNVIYKLIDQTRQLMVSTLDPVYEDVTSGEARVQQVFPITISGGVTQNIAGCRMVSGAIESNSTIKILRNKAVIFDSTVNTLKQVKRDIPKATKGQDCGIGISEFNDIMVDDIIQSYTKVLVEQTLE
ncbi:hypothetical protein BB559_002405 [Furculomyces boomerangus]|uniref:Translation initiation factor IF-2, mitochondrial n=1 Tax=Furculomyces boomerangus TaxID=61424 RepID=A0A2T9YVJ9_9FUNG|nr:hypothetical protein BB559_002405 [Furculomyces boomerangus]